MSDAAGEAIGAQEEEEHLSINSSALYSDDGSSGAQGGTPRSKVR